MKKLQKLVIKRNELRESREIAINKSNSEEAKKLLEEIRKITSEIEKWENK